MEENKEKTDAGITEPAAKQNPEEKNPFWKEALLFVRDIAVYMAVVFLLSNYVIRPVQVIGSSMYPTLEDKEFGFSNLIGYRTDGLKRFDIAIIYIEEKEEYLVKRVIGLPGETVSYTGGQLYINGQAVAEDFLDEEYKKSYGSAFMEDVEPVVLGEDEYYCLGDNRPRSSDSRVYGPFKKDRICSKGVAVLFPFSRIGVHTW